MTAGNGKYFALDQAPVLVTQNAEPNDDPSPTGNAPTIAKNTLIVGHIASGADVDYYKLPADRAGARHEGRRVPEGSRRHRPRPGR